MNWIYVIVLGIVAGYIASRIKGNGGNGCILDLILGVVGSAVGGWIFQLLGISCHRRHRSPLALLHLLRKEEVTKSPILYAGWSPLWGD